MHLRIKPERREVRKKGRDGLLNSAKGLKYIYRFRSENPVNKQKPGDEFFWSLEGGIHLPWHFLTMARVSGLIGEPGVRSQFDIKIPLPRRRLLAASASLQWTPFAFVSFSTEVKSLLAGSDFPAGWQFFFAVTAHGSLFSRRPTSLLPWPQES